MVDFFSVACGEHNIADGNLVRISRRRELLSHAFIEIASLSKKMSDIISFFLSGEWISSLRKKEVLYIQWHGAFNLNHNRLLLNQMWCPRYYFDSAEYLNMSKGQ